MYKLIPMLSILLIHLTATAAWAEVTALFVEKGQPVGAYQQPESWRTGEGVLVGNKMGQFLYGKVKLLEGDVAVKLRMSIDQFAGTATAFILDGNNYVGFDSKSGAVFLQGPRFTDDATIKIGTRDELLKEGEPFDFELKRIDGVFHFYINGELLKQVADPAKAFGTIGVRTHRAKIAVHEFSAEGEAEPISEGFAFDKPSVSFEVPDLTSLQPMPGVETVVVWDSEVDGYNTYRIPSILKTRAGTLLAFCEGRKGSRSDTGDIDMLVKRSDDDGRTWSPHAVIWDDGENVCGNPCPVIDQSTGDIVLLMTHNPGSEHEKDIQAGTVAVGRTPWITRSSDDGKTWTEPRNISDQAKDPNWRWYATGPGVGIQLTQGALAGRLVIPANHSVEISTADGGSEVVQGSHSLYSDDGGKTWSKSEPIRPYCNESQVVELSDGRLMLNARSYDDPVKARRVAFSSDGGETWSDPQIDSQLIEPRCQASLVTFDPGDGQKRLVLFSNPATNYSRRNLVVRASPDDGKTWPIARTLEPGYAAYSCLVQLDEKTIGCLYEGSKPGRPYQWIAFARFDLDWLTEDEKDE